VAGLHDRHNGHYREKDDDEDDLVRSFHSIVRTSG
jgi:hypothetical protein